MSVKTALLYFTYAILMFFILSYLLFPKETASRIMTEQLNRISPELRIELPPMTPVLPLGLKTTNPTLTLFKKNKIPLASLVLSPDFFTLFNATKKIHFKIEAFKGTITGTVSGPPGAPSSGMMLFSNFSNLEISHIQYTGRQTNILADFMLNGNFEYTPAHPLGTARGKLHLSDLKTEVHTPLLETLGLSEFNFTRVDITCTIKKNQFDLLHLDASGDQLNMTLAGTCTLDFPMEKSRLNLKGEIRPDPAYLATFAGISSVAMLFQDSKKGGIPFTISGTVENPIFKL